MPSSSTTKPLGCSYLSVVPRSIFTPEMFVGDELLMIQTAEQFSRKEVLPFLEELDHQEEPRMVEIVRSAGLLGFCGVDAPDKYGGLGQSKTLAARILEFLSLNASVSVTIGITSGISQVGLTLFGSEAQQNQYLPRLTSGEWIGAYALSEPNSGTDALSMSCRADRRGNKWVLNGTKMWISNAKWADLFLVMAKADGERITAFLVERNMPGVSIGPEEHKMGLKGSSTARLTLENAEIPIENLLYEEGKGHHVAFNSLNLGRFKLSSMSIGPAREAISLAATYAQDRRQFGQPIAEFGLIQKKFAEMASRFYAAESMIYRTGSQIDAAFAQFGGSPDDNRRAAEEYAVECSACKVFSTEAEAFIVDEALQVYGGYGYTEEFPLARIYRDARVSRIYEGTNEINRVFIADRFARRMSEGRVPSTPRGDSYISELAARVVNSTSNGQIEQGALSDLLILSYAEQSARLRASQNGGIHQFLYQNFLNWANISAARAFQTATGERVNVPKTENSGVEEISDAVHEKKGPL